MRKLIGLALLLGMVALAPASALAQGGTGASLEQLVIEMADTPAEHAAVAKHYRALAAQARSEAARHDSMGRAYAGRKLAESQKMKQHCAKLAAENNAMAAEYDALAALHEAESKKTQ